ncbi:hypothetical protein Calag_0787 [Caldisphaera lagunensis DSM 15908]|uniref:SAM-dependent chlorinase/fluorinase n=1 Tax=Caldisphaera lagunensis (strain DSM 15908 / JCM 11604 / ANMR 0165 / IC-154) TaxID=1056495 RepID=L0AAT1_CALLD|nr:SAM-dependent chlorinase/fluorinase [Caldisphaera lagunensis]AFZ70529.1 hypothetical protein Calag_0787 [Caldisphaera lagunensis DSM 15908]
MVIGLITDFGNNFYTGIMKGVIKNINNNVSIIDIDNNIPKFSILSGSYVLYTSYEWMPKKAILLAVVDPGVGTERRALILETKNYYFVGPDNGLLYESAINDGIVSMHEIEIEKLNNLLRNKYDLNINISRTFHGRDVFAPSAALLSLNENISLFTKNIDKIVELKILDYIKEDNKIYLKVIYIDDFGNVVLSSKFNNLNIKDSKVVKIIRNGSEIGIKVGEKFADVNEGELLIYENSFGFAEIAMNKGNASKFLGLKIGDEVIISH